MDSHLRILQKKRTANFREDETKLLIQLWGSPLIQNKLFLTHRKAPVMRLLAANMQQRGFYRTPDEIKTRIRNLKCLYHRIKRSLASGTGVGTVDPDWPHFKAMDAILSKEYPRKPETGEDNPLEGPKVEDIKQEIEDIEIHDDVESWATKSICSDQDDDSSPPPLRPAPSIVQKPNEPQQQQHHQQQQQQPIQIQPKPMPIITPSLTIPTQSIQNNVATINGTTTRPGNVPPMVPLLILNGLQPQQNNINNLEKTHSNVNIGSSGNTEMAKLLNQLLQVQKENLEVERKRLEIEKQRLEYDKLLRNQILEFLPMFGQFLQNKTATPQCSPNTQNTKKRKLRVVDESILTGTKTLRSLQNEKSYSTEEESDDKESSNEGDSGIHNDDNSVSSEK